VVSEARTPLIVDFIILELDKMASNNNVHIGKLPHFDGNNYDYWKIRMSMQLKAMGGKIWPIVRDGFIVLKEDEPVGLRGGYTSAKQNFQPHNTKNYCGYRSWNYH
jgi:hypothetical protein